MSDESLHVVLRPKTLDGVVGQDSVVASLGRLLKGGRIPHTFLFTGPSGCGKTTLAKIIAVAVGCSSEGIIEIDAATNSGVDKMRAVTAQLSFRAFGPKPSKMVIIDECHALSNSAWQALLKITESPPPHVYFTFCTTEPTKVPKTIKTRSHAYDLDPVGKKVIEQMLEDTVVGCGLYLPAEEAYSVIARASEGSPRQALVYLSMCDGAQSMDEVYDILKEPMEGGEAFDLARLLFARRGMNWKAAQELLNKIKDQNPESIRIVINRYATAAALRSTSDKDVMKALSVMDAFSRPAKEFGDIVLSVADIVIPK